MSKTAGDTIYQQSLCHTVGYPSESLASCCFWLRVLD